MCRKIDEVFPNWKELIHRNHCISKNLIEMLPIFQQLVKDRNIEGIQEFYQNVLTDPYDINDDRDSYFHQFIMQFCNMNEFTTNEENKEPKTKDNYLCFKVVANRGKANEFSFLTYFKKEELFLADYKYLSFLMYNNLTGLETYLYIYELKAPELKEENETQCNNIVLSFKLDKTEKSYLVHPTNNFEENCLNYVLDELNYYGLTVRNTLINGEDLTVIVDLQRTINLKCQKLKALLKMVESELLNKFSNLHIYDNNGFFMIPGSVNSTQKTIQKKNIFTYENKVIENGVLEKKEFSFQRCYFIGEPFYNFKPASFSEVASLVGFPKTETKKKVNKFSENKIRYTKVGKERLEDLDKLAKMRQNEIIEKFNFFRIMGNILFYLGLDIGDVLQYMNQRNKMLYRGVSEEFLLKIFLFCKEDYEKYLINASNGIKYTNEKIVELLHIRPYEQQEMKQLINQTEAEFRERIRCRIKSREKYEIIKEANQEKKNALKEELLQLRQNGFSNKEIAKLQQIDVRRIDRFIGRDNLKQDLEENIRKMLEEKKTVSEICKVLNVSESKVRRMKKRGN